MRGAPGGFGFGSGLQQQQQPLMKLHNPETYAHGEDWSWHPIVMIASLPHVSVTFSDSAGTVRSVLLLLDSGACGADIMLHARAQRELGLTGSGLSQPQHHFMRGVGGESREVIKLEVMDLPWMDLAGVRFEQVRCMCAGVGGLDISVYSSGIICGDLLARLEWALDYSGKRIGFRRGVMEPGPIGPQQAARGG